MIINRPHLQETHIVLVIYRSELLVKVSVARHFNQIWIFIVLNDHCLDCVVRLWQHGAIEEREDLTFGSYNTEDIYNSYRRYK
jgi:hypothetical protein